MVRVTTADGSDTIFHEGLSECYHSRSGAVDEAIRKFCEPCAIGELALSGSIVILDICFGLGYNTAAALDAALYAKPGCRVKVHGFENDPWILKMTCEVSPSFLNYPLVRKAAANTEAEDGSISISLHMGDARDLIRLPGHGTADAVFLDPFSPRKAPHMWTIDFLKDVRARMRPGARLATYSCARMVRDNLREAGFMVSDGPSVGRKAPSTLATNPA